MKKLICVLLTTSLLAGCASLQYAGNASYSVKPFKDDKGATICCSVDIVNGKEIANLEAHISKVGDNYTVDLKEQGVTAFAGQKISADAVSEMVKQALLAAGVIAVAPVAIPAIGGVLGGAAASGTMGVVVPSALGGAVVDNISTPAVK